MSTTTERSPAIESAKRATLMGKDRLIKTLSFVPDEKLTWTPSSTTRSALQIAAHCGVSNGFFTMIISGVPLPSAEEMPAAFAKAKEAEHAITTREQAVQRIEDSTAAVLQALDALTDEAIASEVVTAMFTAPMPFFMNLPARHMDNHASQIDLLQTCWGDMDWHI